MANSAELVEVKVNSFYHQKTAKGFKIFLGEGLE